MRRNPANPSALPLALSFVLALALVAAPARAQHGGIPANETLAFPAGQDTVSVPFENWGEHIVIPVAVNKRRTLQMVFDTGMPTTGVLLYEGALADSLAFAYGPMRIQVGGAGGGAPIQARLATGVTLDVGGLAVTGSTAIVMPPPPQMSRLHDGIIGATLFQDLVVTLDHGRSVMTLTRRSAFQPPAGATAVPLEITKRRAYVPAGLVTPGGDVVPLKLILDLGAMHPVSLSASKNAKVVVPAGARKTRVGRGMSGAMTGHVGRIAGLELGGHRLSQVVATFPDAEFEDPRGLDQKNGNLGSGVLGRFDLSLDWGGSRLFLVPNHRYRDPFEWDMTGIVYDMGEGGRITVAEVLADSPAQAAGVQPGEELVAVDGQPVDPRELLKQRRRFREEGRELSLTLRAGNRERVVKLKLKRLV
jgi:hypothetical protein